MVRRTMQPLVSLRIGSDKEKCVVARHTARPLGNLKIGCERTVSSAS